MTDTCDLIVVFALWGRGTNVKKRGCGFSALTCKKKITTIPVFTSTRDVFVKVSINLFGEVFVHVFFSRISVSWNLMLTSNYDSPCLYTKM